MIKKLNIGLTKDKCIVRDLHDDLIIEGIRSSDNCYVLSTNLLCYRSFIDDTELWHQRLGHVNYQDMNQLINNDCVRGIPKFKIKNTSVCGSCQLGKQTRTSQKSYSYIRTSFRLELLHMDLIGQTQVESLGGKWYIFVCVDDYFRFY